MSRMFLLFGWTIWKNRRQQMALIRFSASHNSIRRQHEIFWKHMIIMHPYLDNNDSNHTQNDKKEECHDTFVSRNLQNVCVLAFSWCLTVYAPAQQVYARGREGSPDDQSLSLIGQLSSAKSEQNLAHYQFSSFALSGNKMNLCQKLLVILVLSFTSPKRERQ